MSDFKVIGFSSNIEELSKLSSKQQVIDYRSVYYYKVLLWNESIQNWLAYLDFPPTVTSRWFYVLHMWYFQLWSWLNTRKNILPSWMDINPDNIPNTNNKDIVEYGMSRLAKKIFPSFQDDIEAIRNYNCRTEINTDELKWVSDLTDKYYQKIGEDYSGDATNPTWRSIYTPPANPKDGEWRPLQVPNGKFLNSWNTPWTNPNDPSTFTTQKYATPNWGGVKGYEWQRLGPYPEWIQKTLNKYQGDLEGTKFEEYMKQVLDLQKNLTPREKFTAEFWESGRKTAKPCGMWNKITRTFIRTLALPEENAIELMFLLNACLVNAFIIAWDVKRSYADKGGERPVTYLRRVIQNEFIGWRGNTEKTGPIIPSQPFQGFLPYQEPTFVTPPFPGFISGHSTCSSAAATCLINYLRNNKFPQVMLSVPEEFDDSNCKMATLGCVQTKKAPFLNYDTSKNYGECLLMWRTLEEAVESAGMSRLYGGIHILPDHLAAVEIGKNMALYTLEKYKNKK